jgi:hypothetical protein
MTTSNLMRTTTRLVFYADAILLAGLLHNGMQLCFLCRVSSELNLADSAHVFCEVNLPCYISENLCSLFFSSRV